MAKRILIPYRHSKKVVPYEQAAREAGLEPVSVLTSGSVSLNGFDGLLLMGGTDVNPKRYGESAQPETDEPDDERDEIELDLIDQAIGTDLPIFGICRGLQILNVYHGGTLIQHISSVARHDPDKPDRSFPAHEVIMEPGSLLAGIAGTTRWLVNSSHHQVAKEVGPALRVSARDPEDGTIEGLERTDKQFVVAVQWHPEDQLRRHPEQLKLFQRFAEAIRS